MTDPDYAALFASTPSPYLVVDADLVIVEVNRAYLRTTSRNREHLLGRRIFEVFPDNTTDPHAYSVQNLNNSLQRVLALHESDTMALQKDDIRVIGRPGEVEERWWWPINTPVLDPNGAVRWVIHRVEDVTAFVQAGGIREQLSSGQVTMREALAGEMFERALELQRLNEELRKAHTREREVALALQSAMLRSPDLDHHDDVAVRYLPATESMNVCGDWYDVIDLPSGRMSVGVGDVVGHGLEAAAIMGMLRSVLSAAIRAFEQPAHTLEVLGLYARSLEEALNTTAVQVMVDSNSRQIIYSNSGHPPPMLVHEDGQYQLLDQAIDPPLGARPQNIPCSQAGHSYTPGDTLVLYTNGLIKRRDEDIEVGLQRLGETLIRYRGEPPERLADTVLADLGLTGGGSDDIALVIVRLLGGGTARAPAPKRRRGTRGP